MILLPPQIYREFHLSIVIAKKMRMKMKTRVPRNLFGAPERKEGAQLLQETLDEERARFHKRWAVDPLAEDDDKENGPARANSCGGGPKVTPKKRCSPYAKQTSMHDYWRTRKMYEPSKKSPSNCCDAPRPVLVQHSPPQMQSLSLPPTPTQQQQQQQQQQQLQQQQPTLAATESLAEPAAQSTAHEAQPLLDIPPTDKQLLGSVQSSTN